MFPIKDAAAACATYYDISPDYGISPDCWSLNGEQMNALLTPLCWNVSVSLCHTKGSITARPVSYPAGNELSQQLLWWLDIFTDAYVHLPAHVSISQSGFPPLSSSVTDLLQEQILCKMLLFEVFWCNKTKQKRDAFQLNVFQGDIQAGNSLFFIDSREICTPEYEVETWERVETLYGV